MIVAGGTGGHVMPGLAVADNLKAHGVQLYWMGTRPGIEARLVPERGYPLCLISVRGLRRGGAAHWFISPFTLLMSVAQAIGAIWRTKPHVVLGMGGFVAGPGGVAAWLCRRPLVIHEQNAIPGLTNRILSHLARRVLEAFPGSFPAKVGATPTGNPVREDIVAVAEPRQRLSDRDSSNVLVVGGSRGASALNQIVPAALAALGPLDMRVRHQCGFDEIRSTRAHYDRAGLRAEVTAFIEDMAEAYVWSDLIIARAGAITVAEIAAAGVASILIPYPFAVDDHQTVNARYLSDQGAAVLRAQAELTPESLGADISALLHDRSRLIDMACRARELALPKATDAVVTHCMEFINA